MSTKGVGGTWVRGMIGTLLFRERTRERQTDRKKETETWRGVKES